MAEPLPHAEHPRRSRRALLGCGGLLLLALAGLVGLWSFLKSQADRELRALVADIDRREPGGWRLAEIEAARKQPPDGQNAALVVLKVKQLLPTPWPAPVAPGDGPPPAAGPDAAPAPPPPPGRDPFELDRQLGNTPPAVQLAADTLRQLRANLERVAPASDEARKLLTLSEGRYPITWPPGNPIAAVLASQDARAAAHFFQVQAAVQAQDGHPDAALESVRGIVIVARSIGDEPTLISMLIRIACQAIAVNTLERVLAQGEPSPAALEALQRLLDEEQREPVFLHAARGERAVQHELMEAMKDGRLSLSGAAGTPPPNSLLGRLGDLSSAALARRSHPRLLRMMTEFVDVAGQPTQDQAAALLRLEDQAKLAKSQYDVLVGLLVPAIVKVGDASRRSQGNLRTAIAAVALERFRRDRGCWPDRLQDLFPRYLDAVPEDPNRHQALGYKKTSDGVIVYWTGLDGKDGGGQVGPRACDSSGKDMGFRLWTPARRRQPAREVLPEPTPGEVAGPHAWPDSAPSANTTHPEPGHE